MAVACRITYFCPQFHPFVIRLIFHLLIYLYFYILILFGFLLLCFYVMR